MNSEFPIRVKIKDGWEGAGRTGVEFHHEMLGQFWSMVKFDDEEDPDVHKSAGLEVIK